MLQVSQEAQERLQRVLQSGQCLTISIIPGGCNGFSYKYDVLDIDSKSSDEVTVLESPYVCTASGDINAKLINSTLTYEEDGIGGGAFKISNPNATSQCGCGNSFSTF